MKKSLNEKQIKQLLETVEECKQKNKPLLWAFEEIAKKFGRKKNSIRNFYYQFISRAEKEESLKEKYNINLEKHIKQNFSKFSSEEEAVLKQRIEEKLKQGFSVRNACLKLANNNPNLMVRYQNKYRNLTKEKTSKDNILKFPAKEKSGSDLTDEEIKSLFLGIVKLVKKNALKQADVLVKQKLEVINNQLIKSVKTTNDKEKEIEKLCEKNKELKTEIKKLKQKIVELRAISLELIK